MVEQDGPVADVGGIDHFWSSFGGSVESWRNAAAAVDWPSMLPAGEAVAQPAMLALLALHRADFDLVGLHFDDGVRFELVVAAEGGVEADDAFGGEGDQAAEALLREGVGQADDEQAVGDRVGGLARDGFGFDCGRQRQAGLEDQFVEDVLFRSVGQDVLGEQAELLVQAFGGFCRVPNFRVTRREAKGATSHQLHHAAIGDAIEPARVFGGQL